MSIRLTKEMIDMGEPDTISKDKAYLIKARGLIERHTPLGIEAKLTDEGEEYPIALTQWVTHAGVGYEIPAAYVEVEKVGKFGSWRTGETPDNWKFWSFPMDNINKWDSGREQFGHERDRALDTLYVKFNAAYDNCLVTTMRTIIEDGETTPRHDGTKNNSWLSLDLDHPMVAKGFDHGGEYIGEFVRDNRPTVDQYLSR